MSTPQKAETRGRKKKQTLFLECSASPSKLKRGREPLSLPQHAATPVPFSFFKVLIGNFKDVLFIPPMAAFTLNCLAEKYVFLEDATGKFWNIKMSVIDGSLAFYKGWHDFISDHSIITGEFALFTYTGGLLFTVRIFGLSAMERVAFQLKKKRGRCAKDSERTLYGNNCATVGGLTAVSPTVLAKSGIDNFETITCESLRNRMMSITEEGSALLHSYEGLTHRMDENPDAMTKAASWTVKAHSDIKVGLIEMSCSQVQLNEAHDKIINHEKIEQANLHDLEIIDTELYDDETALDENADCSLKLNFDLIEPELIADKVFLTENGICYTTLDEKLTELAVGTFFDVNEQKELIDQKDHATHGLETGSPCRPMSIVSKLDHTNDEDNLMSIYEEHGVHHTNGSYALVKSSLRSSTEALECNKRSLVKFDETCLVAIPSSSYFSFEVCLSDDVQSFIELPKSLVRQISKLKYYRKIAVLQDLSMRSWPVMYHQSFNFVGFVGGWIDFVRENNICQGDTCKFELVNKMELIFLVNVMKPEVSTFDEKVMSP